MEWTIIKSPEKQLDMIDIGKIGSLISNMVSGITAEIGKLASDANRGRVEEREIQRRVFSQSGGAITRVTVDVDTVNVVLKPTAGDSYVVRLVTRENFADENVSLLAECREGILSVAVNEGTNSHLTVEVLMPEAEGVNVSSSSKAGNQLINSLKLGAVKITARDGNVVCKDLDVTSFFVRTGKGNIVVKAVLSATPVDVAAEHGNVIIKAK